MDYDLTKLLPGRSAFRVSHGEDGTHAQTIEAVYRCDAWVRTIGKIFDEVVA